MGESGDLLGMKWTVRSMGIRHVAAPHSVGRSLLVLCAGALVAAGCTPAPGAESASGSSPTQQARSAPRPDPVVLSLSPGQETTNVEPGRFATVTAEKGTITEVSLVGKDGTVVEGELSEEATEWTAGEKLGFGKTYTLAATGVGASGKHKSVSSTFTTAAPSATVAVRTNFSDGQTVGVGMPLIFTFTRPVAERGAVEQAIDIEAEPDTEGAFHWFSDERVVWRPKEYWEPGTTVTVDAEIYGQHFGNGVYGAQDLAFELAVGDKVIAEADGRTHEMSVDVNGSTVRTFDISMGDPEHPTPHGTYTVMADRRNYVMDSSTYGVPSDSEDGYRIKVDYATRLSWSGIFFHSAPWSVGDQGQRNVSHGCINMATSAASWLMANTKPGDLVKVVGSGGQALRPTDGWSFWQMPWDEWTAESEE